MHYRHNFLTNVVLRLDFMPIPTLRNPANFATKPEFSTRIAEKYPIAVSQPTATLSINLGPTASGMVPQITGAQWFHRKVENGAAVVVLAPEFAAIEYGKEIYDHFPVFRTEVTLVINALRELYDIPIFTRIGLRYINEIVMPEGNPLDWKGLISSDLITAVKAGKQSGVDMVRSMHQLQIRKDECEMVFNYGLSNPDYPNALARRVFILDFDGARTNVDVANALTAIDDLNKFCESMFEDSIDNDLRREMESIND